MTGEGTEQEVEAAQTRLSERSTPSLGSSNYDAPLAAGTQVGEYVVEAPLGSGGFGAVYRGVHPVIGKTAAVKVLSTRYSSDPTIVSRFVSEARAVNKIGHGNIIDIFSFGQLPDGRPYYVMELLDGMTLLELIRERGRLSVAESLEILEPIASAIDAAHAAGVAHRDLKPDNVFLARTSGGGWRPKLLDFGVAKLMDEGLPRQHRTATGATLGTPAYMAPEQCIGRNVDHRADIYAFGVVAFEMIVGTPPFNGESQFEVMTAHVSSPPRAPHEMLREVPLGVSQSILWLLEKDRERRPPTLAQAIAAMKAAARGIPFEIAKRDALANQPSPTGPRARPKKPGRAAVFIAPAMVLAAGIAAYVILNQAPPEPAPQTHEEPVVEKPAPEVKPAETAALQAPPVAHEEPRAETIKLEVRGVPANARILGASGQTIGTGAGVFEVAKAAQPISVLVEAPGFERKTVQLTPDRDQAITVQLTAATGNKHTSRVPISSGGSKNEGGKQKINDLEPWQ